ncbi:MAG TPA: ribosome maturation factor RimP [Acidobacteriota bacterium]|nr:ribosome maturation factor RimP [Acidobacteriota bacterium]
MDVAARTEELARSVAQEQGVRIEHVEFVPGARPSILRVYIDKPEGVNLDDCQKVSKHLAVLLEVEDFIDGKYVLEVSSPGIERPLFKADDYRRFAGKEIRLQALEKIDGRRNFKGVIEDFSNGVVTMNCDGTLYRIPFEKIKKANLVYHFD